MMLQLTSQLSEVKAERSILLDRLATIGLGGPLFNLPTSQDSSLSTEPEEELTEDEQEKNYIRSLRPSQRAHYIELKARRDRNKINRGPDIAYIAPDPVQVASVTAALDQAEQVGKRSAGAEFVKTALTALGRKQA